MLTMYKFIYAVTILNSYFLIKFYIEAQRRKKQSEIMQLMTEGLCNYLIYSHFIEYHDKTDKVYEKIQLYRFLINKFENQFSENTWEDFFIKNQRKNYNLFVDTEYGMEPMRSIYLPFFVLSLYKYPETRKDAENIINHYAIPFMTLAEIKAIIAHDGFAEFNDDLSWVP